MKRQATNGATSIRKMGGPSAERLPAGGRCGPSTLRCETAAVPVSPVFASWNQLREVLGQLQ